MKTTAMRSSPDTLCILRCNNDTLLNILKFLSKILDEEYPLGARDD